MHASFEVAITGEDCAGYDVACFDRLGDFRLERAAIANTGLATVTGGVKAKRLKIGVEARFRQIVCHDA